MESIIPIPTTTVSIKTSFEGVHCYEDAPHEVGYLKHLHRHMFGVSVEIEVFHDDREIEFIMLKHRVNEWLENKKETNYCWMMGTMSCEQVAKALHEHLCNVVPKLSERFVAITIDEDGENGATVTYFGNATANNANTNNANSNDGVGNYWNDAYKAIQDHKSEQEAEMHWAIGLGEEAGEVLSVIKHKYYGGEYNREDLVEELGDVLWHINALCVVNGISIDEVCRRNLEKLEKRYPDGKFDLERSKCRHSIDKQRED